MKMRRATIWTRWQRCATWTRRRWTRRGSWMPGGKKVWELVVCDATLSLQFTRFFPNTSINSVSLHDALASVASSLGVPLPDRGRFFRSQMQNCISRACNELGVKAVPSHRCDC
jgi:hypothetical protein